MIEGIQSDTVSGAGGPHATGSSDLAAPDAAPAGVERKSSRHWRHGWIGGMRITAGWIFAIVFIFRSQPTEASIAACAPLFLCGLAFRAWSAGHLVKRKRLVTSGPYSHVRHPLYLGTLVLLVAACVGGRAWILLVLALPLYTVLYRRVMDREEEQAQRSFPDEYARYRSEVPALVPRLRPAQPYSERWSLRRYISNGEYNAALGVIAAVAILALRL